MGARRIVDRLSTLSTGATLAGAAAATAVVAVVDVLTGTEVRVLSLYLLPVAWCSWRLGRRGAAFSAALALAVWGLSQHVSGVAHWTATIWTFNLLSQGLALLAIGALVAELSRRLMAEQAASRNDTLTGLFNRRGLELECARELALCRRHGHAVALAFIDLDDFKQVNDRLGHARGDDVLRDCASVLTTECRHTDVVARLGGDEFVVVMPETTAAQAQSLMQRVRVAFGSAPATMGTGVDLTIGVLAEDPAVHDLDALLAQADALMYAAKRDGKGRVYVRAAGAPGGGVLPPATN